MLGLGTGVLAVSFSLQRKDSKALSGDTFERFAAHTAQHPKIPGINTLYILHSVVIFHTEFSPSHVWNQQRGHISTPELKPGLLMFHRWPQRSLCVLN